MYRFNLNHTKPRRVTLNARTTTNDDDDDDAKIDRREKNANACNTASSAMGPNMSGMLTSRCVYRACSPAHAHIVRASVGTVSVRVCVHVCSSLTVLREIRRRRVVDERVNRRQAAQPTLQRMLRESSDPNSVRWFFVSLSSSRTLQTKNIDSLSLAYTTKTSHIQQDVR
jgi:hypothetical protein